MRQLLLMPLLKSFLLSAGLNAALPPLSEDQLQAEASHIVEGVVNYVDIWLVDHGHGYQDMNYRVRLLVSRVIKGEGLTLDAPMDIYYWKMWSRPRGWAGPSGQMGRVLASSTIRAYLRMNGDRHELLEPNGFVEIAE